MRVFAGAEFYIFIQKCVLLFSKSSRVLLQEVTDINTQMMCELKTLYVSFFIKRKFKIKMYFYTRWHIASRSYR